MAVKEIHKKQFSVTKAIRMEVKEVRLVSLCSLLLSLNKALFVCLRLVLKKTSAKSEEPPHWTMPHVNSLKALYAVVLMSCKVDLWELSTYGTGFVQVCESI